MTDVTLTNRRADSSANADLTRLARHGADAFGYRPACASTASSPSPAPAGVADQQLHLLPQPPLRGRTRRRHPPPGDLKKRGLRKSCDGGCGVLRGRRLRHAGRGV